MTDREVLRRSFEVDSVQGNADGRTIIGRVVPYGVIARVADPGGPPYDEEFAPGSFTRATRVAPQRIALDYEHRGGLMDTIGYGTAFDEQEDGLWGSFRALDRSLVADQALAMIEAEMIRGFSVGFVPLGRGKRGTKGQTIRIACHLESVSLTKEPAYDDAVIAAVRARHPASVVDLSEFRVPRNAQLDERIASLRRDE